MTREREYEITDVDFKGKAYKRDNRKIIKNNSCGILSLPRWMIGMEFDVILIPHKGNIEAVL